MVANTCNNSYSVPHLRKYGSNMATSSDNEDAAEPPLSNIRYKDGENFV